MGLNDRENETELTYGWARPGHGMSQCKKYHMFPREHKKCCCGERATPFYNTVFEDDVDEKLKAKKCNELYLDRKEKNKLE